MSSYSDSKSGGSPYDTTGFTHTWTITIEESGYYDIVLENIDDSFDFGGLIYAEGSNPSGEPGGWQPGNASGRFYISAGEITLTHTNAGGEWSYSYSATLVDWGDGSSSIGGDSSSLGWDFSSERESSTGSFNLSESQSSSGLSSSVSESPFSLSSVSSSPSSSSLSLSSPFSSSLFSSSSEESSSPYSSSSGCKCDDGTHVHLMLASQGGQLILNCFGDLELYTDCGWGICENTRK